MSPSDQNYLLDGNNKILFIANRFEEVMRKLN